MNFSLNRPGTKGTLSSNHPLIKSNLNLLELKQRAILVALGLVYYMRLDTSYRKRFVEEMDQATVSFRFLFKEAFNDEVSGHYMNVHN